MFEVMEIGPLTRKRWFKSRLRVVKLKTVASAQCEKISRSFEGHGNYSTQLYRAEFTEGEVITVGLPASQMLSIGDRMSLQSIAALGAIEHCFRMVAA